MHSVRNVSFHFLTNTGAPATPPQQPQAPSLETVNALLLVQQLRDRLENQGAELAATRDLLSASRAAHLNSVQKEAVNTALTQDLQAEVELLRKELAKKKSTEGTTVQVIAL